MSIKQLTNDVQAAFLRPAQVCAYLNIGRTKLWHLEQTCPDWPRKIVISSRCVGYRLADLDAWLARQVGC